MLFIGDIHITMKHTVGILQCIDQCVDAFPDEQTIIFLGDYVYHFTYDRKALLLLFKKIITLAKLGKEVCVLAGNHDRINDHFVYEEARQAFKMLSKETLKIHFITDPIYKQIEGIDCLLLPYYHPTEVPTSGGLLPDLQHATHPYQQLSRKINNILHDHIQHRSTTRTTEKLLIIHHRYFAGKKFPGQQAIFSYNNGALMPDFLEDQRLRFVSGHLHEAFGYGNYLCTGSVRSTSPLETNQQKYCFRLRASSWEIDAHPITYNHYFTIVDPQEVVTTAHLDTLYQSIHIQMKQQLAAGQRSVHLGELPPLSLTDTTLTIQSSLDTFEDMQNKLSEDLHESIADMRYKKLIRGSDTLLEELDTASLDLTQRFSDRKLLLKLFLTQKYGEQSADYLVMLEELKIL